MESSQRVKSVIFILTVAASWIAICLLLVEGKSFNGPTDYTADELLNDDSEYNSYANYELVEEDECYDRFRLPKHARATHYELLMRPNLESFIFSGKTSIQLQVDLSKLDEHNNFSNEDESVYIENNQIVISMKGLKMGKIWLENNETEQEQRRKIGPRRVCISPKYGVAVLSFDVEKLDSSLSLHFQFTGQLQDNLLGFYRSLYVDREGNEKYLAVTQFESVFARQAFPCMDEPSQKATFDISLIVSEGLTALSNTAQVEEHLLKKSSSSTYNERLIKFARSPIMSTYLVAFVVGEFDYLEGKLKNKKNTITTTTTTTDTDNDDRIIRVYTPIGMSHRGKYALDIAIETLNYLEEYFQIEFPLAKLDLVSIADFEAGAMENWGLITFAENYLLVEESQTSPSTKARVAQTVMHELVHQWFGNLVTMNWWNDLWLNEGFATYMAYHVASELYPELDMMYLYVTEAHTKAIDADMTDSTHPIQFEIDDPKNIESSFDVISYQKSSVIIRVLHQFLGDEIFRDSLRHYLSKNAYENTETDDLWASFEVISGKNIRHLMHTWTQQPGLPWIKVEIMSKDDQTTELLLKQRRMTSDGSLASIEATQNIWNIPIAIEVSKIKKAKGRPKRLKSTNSFSKKTENAGQLLMNEKFRRVVVNRREGQWIKLNPAFAGYYLVYYPEEMREDLYDAIRTKEMPAEDRAQILYDTDAFTRSGIMTIVDSLNLLQNYADEDHELVWYMLNTVMAGLDDELSERAMSSGGDRARKNRENFLKFAHWLYGNAYKTYGWTVKSGENLGRTIERARILKKAIDFDYGPAVEDALKLFDRHQGPDGYRLDSSIEETVFSAVARKGTDQQYDRLFKLYESSDVKSLKNSLRYIIMEVDRSDRAKKALDWVLSPAIRSAADTKKMLMYMAYYSKATQMELWQRLIDDYKHILSQIGPNDGNEVMMTLLKYMTIRNKSMDHVYQYLSLRPLGNSDTIIEYYKKIVLAAQEQTDETNIRGLNEEEELEKYFEYWTARKKMFEKL